MRAVTLTLCAVAANGSWTRKLQKRGGAARACQEEPSLTSVPRAFDGDECARILALFEEAKEEVDRRDAMGISRRNRWLPRDKWDSMRWVVERMLSSDCLLFRRWTPRPSSSATWSSYLSLIHI